MQQHDVGTGGSQGDRVRRLFDAGLRKHWRFGLDEGPQTTDAGFDVRARAVAEHAALPVCAEATCNLEAVEPGAPSGTDERF
jgi:hypothetical protein